MTIRTVRIYDNDDDAPDRHDAIVEAARPAFAGEHPADVGSALSELVAIWLAGHQVSHDERKRLLDLHVETTLQFLPMAEAAIDELLKAETGGTH